MAETLNLTLHWEIAGKPEVRGGSKGVPISFSLTTGTPHYAEHTIADAFGEDVLWSSGDGGKDTFQLMIIQANISNQWVELKDDQGTPEFIALPLLENVPLILTGDEIGTNTTSAFDGAVLVDNTDYNNIVQVELHNDNADAAGDAVVKVWVFD